MIREKEELVPSRFYLSQNFPNPFKNSTNIKYCLPMNTKVNITVFNSEKEKVNELVNKIQEAGTYELKFERADLTAGLYFYRMLAETPLEAGCKPFVKVKKMVLLR
jgi:hypothetical protein